MTITNECIAGTLSPYQPDAVKPWNQQRVLHLYRRLGFGASFQEVQAALNVSPTVLVDQLIDEALALPPIPAPEWAEWILSDFGEVADMIVTFDEWRPTWIAAMAENGLREKLALFWSNHFVTEYEGYVCAPYAYRYLKLLQTYALGNFRDFVSEIGKTPAMLAYLNGAQNTKLQPNENYARELFELFTLGHDNNYTQNDIVETARALSGWTIAGALECAGEVVFIQVLWDNGMKTIFGQTGNWGYDDVINLLFTHRQQEMAQYICAEIYKFFVFIEPKEDIVNELAQTFIDNNFELAPVLRQLFKSEHFFDEEVIGTQIKSPLDFILSFSRALSLPQEELVPFFKLGADFLGQFIFNPVDVAGWPGQRSWIDTSKLTNRWQVSDYLLSFAYQEQPENLRALAKALSGDSTDPFEVTQSIIDFLIPNGLQDPAAYEQATVAFKSEIPQNYFDNNLWSLDWDIAPGQVALLLYHIGRLPEFQLG